MQSLFSNLYNMALSAATHVAPAVAKAEWLISPQSKVGKLIAGQVSVLRDIEAQLNESDRRPIIWIHCASLGEFGVARPIIKALAALGKYRIVLTFFSPSGYEPVARRHPDIDHVFYLPFDSKSNVNRFLDLVRPEKAVFIISEYWLTYLTELQRRGIPTYLVSALVKGSEPFFKFYGNAYRKALEAYTHIFTLNAQSQELLEQVGYRRTSVTGNPLFDNAIAVAETPWSDNVIAHFAADRRHTFVGGSISDDNDLRLVASLANSHRDTRFIIVPHEISEAEVKHTAEAFKGKAKIYSECNESTDFSDTQVLIINTVGALAYVYRYGAMAYVGGGFTPLLHSLIEASVYGLPVSFGPMIKRKITPNEMIKLGIGAMVTCEDDINSWFDSLNGNDEALNCIADDARRYIFSNRGATATIIKTLTE